MIRFLFALFLITSSAAAFSANEFAASPEQVRPVLLASKMPDVAMTTLAGKATTLKAVAAGKPVIFVFYRGGWCPFCNLQLSDLRLIQKQTDALGYQMIGISPDLPAELNRTLDKHQLKYTLLSDSKANAMRAFGIGYQLDAATIEKYKGYGIDLEKNSGEKHHGLPVPSVFIIDADGIIQFSYVNPDYKARVPSSVVLAAAPPEYRVRLPGL
ncbi:MAG: peroxiredoxin-like family protein, partial [Arenimonas sp.]